MQAYTYFKCVASFWNGHYHFDIGDKSYLLFTTDGPDEGGPVPINDSFARLQEEDVNGATQEWGIFRAGIPPEFLVPVSELSKHGADPVAVKQFLACMRMMQVDVQRLFAGVRSEVTFANVVCEVDVGGEWATIDY
jgi:hypothetical protein